jgi:hypothetical protein
MEETVDEDGRVRVEKRTLSGDAHVTVVRSPVLRSCYLISYWGPKDDLGEGDFERIELFNGRIIQSVTGRYGDWGVDFGDYKGRGKISQNLREPVDVCLAFSSAGGDLKYMLDLINKATADEGGFFDPRTPGFCYRNYTDGKIVPEIEEALTHRERRIRVPFN